MTENGTKNEDNLVAKSPRNKASDRSTEGVLNIQLENVASGSKEITSPQANSFIQQCSPRETRECYNKKNDTTARAGFSKKTSASRLAAFFPGLRHTKDNWKERESINNEVQVESNEIPRKTKDERDARNFRSMTIDRMGKMLKLKSSDCERNEFDRTSQGEGETRRVSYPCENPSRKEKTNSLGRMLKLMDKDVGPRKIFGQSKSASGNRLPKSEIPLDKEEKPLKVSDDRIRRAFSKMLSQIRGRAGNANASAEPNFRAPKGKSKISLPRRPHLSSTKDSTSLSPDPASSPSGNSEHQL
ncbi:uncharacterized protein LOC117172376 [Belonocnema kinseyi]|uniref:uncharacterized protein LOC117172376 n=1 Tax=Belonocnema kinseyi TaxID=2817044 RepID=UPI00143D11AB|nr:uncharacterized protein LOC117172376 [Belonocnema kinseyi]